MTTLHLSVLNEGAVYEPLKRVARRHHSGQLTDSAAFSEYRGIVCQVANHERRTISAEHSAADCDTATREVMAYHTRHIAEDPPAYSWVVTRGDDGRKVRFVREQDAFAYILRSQGQSVHYALTYGGWSYGSIAGAE